MPPRRSKRSASRQTPRLQPHCARDGTSCPGRCGNRSRAQSAVRVPMPAAANGPGARGASRAARWLLAPPSCGVPEGTPRRSSLRFPLSLPGSFASLATITPGRLLGRRAADAPCRLLIGVFDAAEVAPEAVLVELLARPLVPEAAGVGADLVGEQDFAVVAAELELHVDQHDAALVEVLAQERVHVQRRLVDGREL